MSLVELLAQELARIYGDGTVTLRHLEAAHRLLEVAKSRGFIIHNPMRTEPTAIEFDLG